MTTKKEHTRKTATRPRRTLAQGLIVAQRGALTRIGTLTRDLIGRLEYQGDPDIQGAWSRERYHPAARFEGCTRRRQRECFQLIASLPAPFCQRLQAVTKEILGAADPDSELLERQAALIMECRAHLRQAALHLRETGKATVRAAVAAPAKVKTPIFHEPWPWTWPKLPGALEYD
jgi:hypothetical protein